MLVKVPDDVLKKIKYLCKRIPDVEWSGVLFYEVKGTIKSPEKMKIVLKDILLMDKGSSAHTEYNFDEDVAGFMMDTPEAMDWKIGHIHSHNNMTVFFSSEDTDELDENCRNHNYYLSIIVNNRGDILGKVAFTGDPSKFVCKDDNGKDYIFECTGLRTKMFVFDCEIEYRQEVIKVSKEFDDRIDSIVKSSQIKAEEKTKKWEEERKKSTPTSNINNPAIKHPGYPNPKNSYPDYNGSNHKAPEKQAWKDDLEEIKYLPAKVTNTNKEGSISPEADAFVSMVLRCGTQYKDDTIEEALDDLVESGISEDAIVPMVTGNFMMLYTKFYDDDKTFGTLSHFSNVMDMVIKGLKEHLSTHTLTQSLLDGLLAIGVETVAEFESKNKTKLEPVN